MRVLGVLCIILGLVFIIGLQFVGPPGSRAERVWTPYNKINVALAGVVGIVIGVLLLVGGVD